MKTFSKWLKEERDPADKSEGHKRASLLASYMDENDLLAGLMGQPTRPIVYRFLAIIDSLPAHEKLEFQKQLERLQMNAMMTQDQLENKKKSSKGKTSEE